MIKSVITIAILFITFQLYAGDMPDINEESAELKKLRENWINEINRCEPGIDWRIINNETRKSKQELRNNLINNLVSKGKLVKVLSGVEFIADGKIIGNWIEKGSNNQAGRVMTTDIDFERGLIYLISQGGNVWRGDLDGSNWTCLNDRISFNGSLIRILNNGNSKRILVISDNTVYYTENEGLTWFQAKGLENISKWGGIKRGVIANDEKNTIYLISNEWDYKDWHPINILYYSTDNGNSFDTLRKYDENVKYQDLWAPRYGNELVYMINQDTLFTISDGNVDPNYNIISGDIDYNTLSEYNSLILKGTNINSKTRLFLAMNHSQVPRSHFFYSDDIGKDWTFCSTLDFGPFNKNSFAVSAKNSDMFYFGGVELYRTPDIGANWEKVNNWGAYYGDPDSKLHADIPGIDIFETSDGSELILISTDGGLYISNDSTHNVTNLSLNGLNVSQYYDVHTSRNDLDVIYAGSQDQGFQRCQNDSGATLGFDQTISGDYGHLTSSDKGSTLWSVYPGFAMLYKYAETQMLRYSWNFEGKGWQWMPNIVAYPGYPDVAYIAAGGINGSSNLWKLTLNNESIDGEMLPFDFSSLGANTKLASIGISSIDNSRFYSITNNGKFLTSSDKGSSWELKKDFEINTGHYFYGACVLPSSIDNGKVYVAGTGYQSSSVWVSHDHGITFTPIDSGLPNTLVYNIVATEDEKLLFAATPVGPYVYIVEDSVWYDLSGLNAPDQNYWAVEYIPELKTARFATYGRGIWDFKISEINTSKSDVKISNHIQIDVAPVPVGEYMNVHYQISNPGEVIVKVYDIQGRVVVSDKFYSISTDGILTVNIPYGLERGFYQLIVVCNGNSITKKIIIK